MEMIYRYRSNVYHNSVNDTAISHIKRMHNEYENHGFKCSFASISKDENGNQELRRKDYQNFSCRKSHQK